MRGGTANMKKLLVVLGLVVALDSGAARALTAAPQRAAADPRVTPPSRQVGCGVSRRGASGSACAA